MSDNKSLTTGQAARYCHVSQATIINWIKEKKLEAYTTPGGHHRILLPDFLTFLKTYKMPVDATLRTPSRSPRVLIVSDGPQGARLRQTLQARGYFEATLACSEHEAGAQVVRLKPDAVVLDARNTTLDWSALCRWLHASPEGEPIPVLIVGSPKNEEGARAAGAEAYLPSATVSERLEAELKALLHSSEEDL